MATVSRGDVVLAVTPGDYGKPRPWLVVQADEYNAAARPGSILACPFTTYEEAAPYRVRFDLPAGEAVRRSYVMVDKLTAVRRDRLGAQIGRASSQQMQQVASAMRGILGLIEP